MRYTTLLSMFNDHIYKPHDYTDCFWYYLPCRGGIHYSNQDDTEKNPDTWGGGGYTSEFVRDFHDKKGYRIATLDDGCGGEFQAFFKLSMKINPEEFD